MKIKTGLASFGLSGQVFHAPFIDVHDGFELTAVVERSKNTAASVYPGIRSVRSFEELLKQDIELVVVNTPDLTHYDFCRMALEAGKNVVVEKPFVTTVAEAEALIELAQRKKLLLTVYQNRRFDGDFMTLQQIIASGKLGRIVEFQSAFQRYRPVLKPGTWKETGQCRVGITYNLCSHLCDQALILFGKPEGVWATMARQRDGGLADDYCFMQLIYPNVKVSLRAGMLIREEGPRFALHGTEGSFVKFGLDPQENALRNEGAVPSAQAWCKEPAEQWGILNTDEGRTAYPTVTGNYMRYYDNLYTCLREGAAAAVSHEDMLTDMKILQAAFESDESGNTVKI